MRGQPCPASPSKRPTSATIAATPLEKLPKDIVAEATRLLYAGPDVLEQILKDPLSKLGLRRQGFEASELLMGVARTTLHVAANSVQGRGLEAERAAVESRHTL